MTRLRASTQGTPGSSLPPRDITLADAAPGNSVSQNSSSSSSGGSRELAYLKKLAADLQAKIEQLESVGADKLQKGVDAVKHAVGADEASPSPVQKHLGILLMGPPGSGE